MKNAIKLLSFMMVGVSMIFLSSCNKDEGSITPITIDFSGSAGTVAENGGAQTVTVLFSAEAPIDATFDVAISGTAEYGTDFTTSPDGATGTATVNVNAGDASATFTFTPIDNENVDGDKTAIFTITGSADGVELGSALTYTITIDDEEGPSNVDFAAEANEVAEDAGAVTVTLNFGTTTTAPGTVDVTMTGDVSAVTTDPAATADVFTVSSASGADEVTFTVTPMDDAEFTGTKEVTFTLSNATNGVELGTKTTYKLTIIEDDPMTIASLRALYTASGDTTLASGKIAATVTSEKGNITGRNIVVQDGTDGIIVRFTADNENFDLGDELSIELSGGTLTEFGGIVQVSDLELSAATELTAGTLPAIEAESITLAEFMTGDYQSKLVTVNDLAFSGADGTETFGSFETYTLSDASGASFGTFVRGGSQLEGTVIPVGVGSATGVSSAFSGTVQLLLRVSGDLSMAPAAVLDVTATDTDFGAVANGEYSAVKTYSLALASGTLQGNVTVETTANFEVSVDGGTTFGTSGTIESATVSAGASVQVRFYANTGSNGAKDGKVSFSSFGVASSSVSVMGEETGNGAVSAPTDLFFSEYVEGSSNNKYLEIYNGTGADIDLSDYQINRYGNGGTEATSYALGGTIADGSVIVIANSGADVYTGTVYSETDVNGATFYNGDDVVELYKISTSSAIDIIGQIGCDPGSAWASGSHSTGEKTLRRKATVNAGVSVNPTGECGPTSFATLETEWDVYDQNDVSGLGSHTFGND